MTEQDALAIRAAKLLLDQSYVISLYCGVDNRALLMAALMDACGVADGTLEGFNEGMKRVNTLISETEKATRMMVFPEGTIQ